MRISVIQPAQTIIVPAEQVSGASVALESALFRYANSPSVEALEIYLLPRDLIRSEDLRATAASMLLPENRGRGKLEFHSIYSIPDLWSDGKDRVIYVDDLHLLARDRDLRDRYAAGPTVLACDVQCLGHRALTESLARMASLPSARIDRIYAPSTAAASAIERTLDFFGTPKCIEVSTQPRMIVLDGLAPCSSRAERDRLRLALGIPAESAVALSIGRMTPATKGDLVTLVEVFAVSSGAHDHLVIAGTEQATGYAETVRRTAAKVGCAKRLHVTGGYAFQSRGDLYRAADFAVFPADSGNEVFGQVAVEAMACGLPVVATDWDGLKDTVEHGVNGFRIPTYEPPPLGRFDDLSWVSDDPGTLLLRAQATVVDCEEMATAFRSLFSDPDLRTRMGSAALETVAGRLNPDHLFDKLLNGYADQLATARAETADEAAHRREWAHAHPLATPLNAQFAGYGTSALLAPGISLQTSARGQRALNGLEEIEVLGELRCLMPASVIQTILHKLQSGLPAEQVDDVARAEGIPVDVFRFTLAVLAKHNYVLVKKKTVVL